MDTYFLFIDECGSLNTKPSHRFLVKHPFYIRACLAIPSDEWMRIRDGFCALKKQKNLELMKEIKRSDIWGLCKYQKKGESIDEDKRFYPIRDVDYHDVMAFAEAALGLVLSSSSAFVFYTITKNAPNTFGSNENGHYFHLQEIMQRAQLTMKERGSFGVMFIDSVSKDHDKMIQESYVSLSGGDRYVRTYSNLKDGLSIENSHDSIGMQLSDYYAGVLQGAIKNYSWSMDVFTRLVLPKLRHSSAGRIMGYGLREVPSQPVFRSELISKLRLSS